MVRMGVLNDCLRSIVNAEKAGKRQVSVTHPYPQVLIRPISKVVVKFLKVMQKHGYINEFEIIDDKRGSLKDSLAKAQRVNANVGDSNDGVPINFN